MRKGIAEMERELRASGHQVERTFEAPVGSRQELADAGWVVRLDGKVVARGGSIGELEDALRQWLSSRS